MMKITKLIVEVKNMELSNNNIKDTVIEFEPLTYIMKKNGFILAGQWDYERVTYDYKIKTPEKNVTYYLRVRGYAIEGDIDSKFAVIKLLTPIVGKHYYPHGVEYGEDEIPNNIKEKCERILAKLNDDLNAFKEEQEKEKVN